VPHLAVCIFLFFYNEPELGVGIDPVMALTPLPPSIGQGSNPRPSDCELSALPLDHSFCSHQNIFLKKLNIHFRDQKSWLLCLFLFTSKLNEISLPICLRLHLVIVRIFLHNRNVKSVSAE